MELVSWLNYHLTRVQLLAFDVGQYLKNERLGDRSLQPRIGEPAEQIDKLEHLVRQQVSEQHSFLGWIQFFIELVLADIFEVVKEVELDAFLPTFNFFNADLTDSLFLIVEYEVLLQFFLDLNFGALGGEAEVVLGHLHEEILKHGVRLLVD